MTSHQLMTGIGIGVVAGTALGMAMSTTKKRDIRRAADKAVRAVGEMVENLSESMGM
ncbi:MAG: hypothetical protein RR216_00030 [Pseudoflavonifractor sp.]